jgi:outer membrane protein TolC
LRRWKRIVRNSTRWLIGLVPACVICVIPAYAAAPAAEQSLPEPLTLEHALSFSDRPHPDLEQAYADLDLARARAQSVESVTGTNVGLRARAYYIEPSELATDQTHDDHSASLFARKRLYDFGRTGHALDAANADVAGQEWRVADRRAARRIDIAERFFDVLLADLRYARDYEAMSIAFVRYDQAQDRRKQGQLSAIDVAERHTIYQDTRRLWYQSTTEQRNTRARLAQAMRWSGRLPAALAMPDLKNQLAQLPDVGVLQAQALLTSPLVLAARERVSASGERISSARAGRAPTLDAEVEVSAYSRDLGSRDRWRAGLTLDVPLYTGGKVGADVAQQQAELRRAQAQLNAQETEVKLAVFELHNRLGTLRVQREEAQVLSDYRELYLDRSRLLYEQEMRTDLGDAMVRTSDARLRTAETEFAIALTMMRVEALIGKPLQSLNSGEKK